MGLLDSIRADAQKASSSKRSFFYVKDGEKKRIRFLQDMEDGWEIPFHDSYELNINLPCQEIFNRECQYCNEEGLRTRSMYAWCVWDYDAAEVKIFMYAMNNCTPLATIAAMYETFGTLKDRDYVVSRSGKQQNTQYTVIPMEKEKMRNSKAKPFSYETFLEKLDEAYPDEHAPKDAKKKSNKKPSTKSKKQEEEDDEDELPWGETEKENKYEGKSAKELYKLCEKRDIECEPKMSAKYYINLLEEDDEAHEDWDEDEEDDDEWEE